MAQPFIQASFNSGEWAPHLWSRTDIEKYHSGAALLRNFFVDYRGGASTRSGTGYCLRGFKDSTAIRLIPFQASISVGYALEFGDEYIRFYRNGAPVLETGLNITGATKANPCVVTVANTYSVGDWVYISGVGGMTQLNDKYYVISARDAGSITLEDLFGNAVDSSGYGTYTSGGTVQRVYTVASPYAAADLAAIKFSQNIDVLILTHPDYVPYSLTFASETSWALSPITFGTTAIAPSSVNVTTSLGAGSTHYAYVVTSVDGTGQESEPSNPARLDNKNSIFATAGTNTITWSPVSGAAYYNVYRAIVSYSASIPDGAAYGYIGNTKATSFADSNITADFSQPPPTLYNPFATGSKVTAVTVTNPGSYSPSPGAPTVTFSAPAGGGVTATGTPSLGVITAIVSAGGSGYVIGDTITLANGVVLTVATVVSTDHVGTVTITNPGAVTVIPSNPQAQVSSSGSGTGATFTLTWGVMDIIITNPGSGYIDPSDIPTITFSTGTAAATATLGPASVGNPSVSAFFQQRLVLAAPESQPNALFFSRPGNYFNYDISIPAQDQDSITTSIVSGQLANIKSMIPQPGGLIVFCDGVSYLINGGSLGSAISPASATANAQSFLGANNMPPIVVNFDVLYVQSKGSSVRDSTYNFYANVFTGTDISVISSHLFFGYQLLEWAWAEEPYKIVQAIRNDGTMLTLTFVKEQEFIAWTHSDTGEGEDKFKSICSIVEAASVGFQNFTYVVVERTINGQTVQYIEYFPERAVTSLAKDYWTVDCGIQYNGSPATEFSGAEFLAGRTVTGLADGVVIPPFVMPATGDFTLTTPASKVTVGIGFTCELQTLYLDLKGTTSTVQTKEKKINGIGLRVTETLGLEGGTDATNALPMKDLIVGNVGRMTNERVTDLVTGDAFIYIDPKWQEPGQVYVRQALPYPASILGYIPQVAVGDTGR